MNRLTGYLHLMRLHRPIGFFLLLWPTVWALWIASHGLPPLRILCIFLAGVFIMRSSGCVINDMVDRRWDGKVKRTEKRPLVTGVVSLFEAWLLLALLCSLALALALLLQPFTLLLAAIGLLITIIYPFTKRFLPMPQAVLGLAFAWGIPMAFAEITQHIPPYAWLLFIATACWIIAYDTQYALADRADDLTLGIHSSAILFGRFPRVWIAVFQIMMLFLLAWLGIVLAFTPIFFVMLIVSAAFILYQHYLIYALHPERCIRAFNNNHWLGAAIFLGIVLGGAAA